MIFSIWSMPQWQKTKLRRPSQSQIPLQAQTMCPPNKLSSADNRVLRIFRPANENLFASLFNERALHERWILSH